MSPPKPEPVQTSVACMPVPRLSVHAALAAKRLLGAIIEHRTHAGAVAGRIVETEAYDQQDPASHSCRGVTPRTVPMFGPAGHAYIYRSYGIHLCLNITCGDEGVGAAVLVRALEPLWGEALMAQRRGLLPQWQSAATHARIRRRLCCGPGNVAQALGLTIDQSGAPVLQAKGALRLLVGMPVPARARMASKRVGISVAQDVLWRFFERDNLFVSASRRA